MGAEVGVGVGVGVRVRYGNELRGCMEVGCGGGGCPQL